MRLLLIVLGVAASVGVAACGGDDDSGGQTQTAVGATEQSRSALGQSSDAQAQAQGGGDGGANEDDANTGPTGPSDSASDVPRSSKELEKRLRARRPTRRGEFKGANATLYYEGRSRCLAIPLRSLARLYAAPSDSPQDVAQAYADKQAPTGTAHRAALAGCLDGINSALRHGP